jgi:hypothetical protein
MTHPNAYRRPLSLAFLSLIMLAACSRHKSKNPVEPGDTTKLGFTWSLKRSGGDTTLRNAAWANEQFACVGDRGLMLTSRDGAAWTTRTLPTNLALSAVTALDFKFFVLNDSYEEPGWINVSEDGEHWTSYSNKIVNVLSVAHFHAYDLIAVGNDWSKTKDYVMTSSDGLTWNQRELGPYTGLKSVVWDGAGLLAVGGGIYWSLDGADWIRQLPDESLHLNSVAFGGGRFVAVGDSGRVMISEDGKSWTKGSSGQNANLYGIVYGQTGFIAVGENGLVLTTPEGNTWTPRNSGTTRTLRSIASNGGSLAAVGDWGTVVVSSP